MPFDNNRNSRDDKSKKPLRSDRPRSDSASKTKRFKTEKIDPSTTSKKKLFDGDKKKPFTPGTRSEDKPIREPGKFGKAAGRDGKSDERASNFASKGNKPGAAQKEPVHAVPAGPLLKIKRMISVKLKNLQSGLIKQKAASLTRRTLNQVRKKITLPGNVNGHLKSVLKASLQVQEVKNQQATTV